MPDYNAPNSLSDFVQAAKPAAPQATVILQLAPEVMDWFQQQGPGWQAEMSSVLKSHMQDIQSMDRHAPPEPDGMKP